MSNFNLSRSGSNMLINKQSIISKNSVVLIPIGSN